jgi:hypothetical protein
MKRKLKTKTAHASKNARKATKSHFGFRWERVAIVTTGFALLLFVITPIHRPVMESVQGVSIVKNLYAQATINLPDVAGIKYYNIYYGSSADAGFPNAVRNIDPNVRDYTISYLKRNMTYHYKIAGVNFLGAESYWTPTQTITNEQPM